MQAKGNTDDTQVDNITSIVPDESLEQLEYKSCPVTHEEGEENDEKVNCTVKSIPYSLFDFGLVNLMKFKFQGETLLKDCIKKYGSTAGMRISHCLFPYKPL